MFQRYKEDKRVLTSKISQKNKKRNDTIKERLFCEMKEIE